MRRITTWSACSDTSLPPSDRAERAKCLFLKPVSGGVQRREARMGRLSNEASTSSSRGTTKVLRMCAAGMISTIQRRRYEHNCIGNRGIDDPGLVVPDVVPCEAYRKAGPHEALIVYGVRGTRIIKGH